MNDERKRDGAHLFPEGSDHCVSCGLAQEVVEADRLPCPGHRAAGWDWTRSETLHPHRHAEGWHHFGLREFVEQGVLQEVNRRVLWPLGLALCVTVPNAPDGSRDFASGVLCLIEPEPIDSIVSAGPDRQQAYASFEAYRRAAIAEGA